MKRFILACCLMVAARLACGQPFDFPTSNHALYEKGGEDRFFAPVPGKTWVSGTFGCVRTDGHQMHEGLDIRCLQRDRHGEPTDPVMATDDGTVAYVNNKPSLSNYGRYIVLQHVVEGLEVYSLYAHLSEARADLKAGKAVKRGEQIGVMGRTSNTRERIGKDRAHVHFELNLFYNERFDAWYRRHFPGERNDHGIWNGENLVGMDARLILLAEREEGPKFSLLSWVRGRTELCRVQVRKTDCSWLRRYPMLVKPNPSAAGRAVAGYEIALDYNGLPFEWIPRTAPEMKGSGRYELLSVNAAEAERNPCRRLVAQRGSGWELAEHGLSLLELLTE